MKGSAGASVQSVQSKTVPLQLLHLEDNAADAMLMQEYLRELLPRITFDTAARLSEVTVERVQAADCALVDLSLPDASRLDALLALREMSEDLPIIVLTGFDDMELGLSAVRHGADDYLLKNHVDGYSLQRAVQYAIERRRLMLQASRSDAEVGVTTPTPIAAEGATAQVLRLVDEGAVGNQPADGTAGGRAVKSRSELLTPAEVSAMLYVDPKTVTRWAIDNKIGSVRTPGGHRRFFKYEILALMQATDQTDS